MNDLLREFCELAPKEWKPLGSGEAATLNNSRQIVLSNDHASAEAIIFLWDYLNDNRGMAGVERCEDGYRVETVDIGDAEGEYVTWSGDQHETRIEALVRACVAYWKAKETPDAS